MHHVNVKSQAICLSVTALGLPKKKNKKMNEMCGQQYPEHLTLHMILVKLKVAINADILVQHV